MGLGEEMGSENRFVLGCEPLAWSPVHYAIYRHCCMKEARMVLDGRAGRPLWQVAIVFSTSLAGWPCPRFCHLMWLPFCLVSGPVSQWKDLLGAEVTSGGLKGKETPVFTKDTCSDCNWVSNKSTVD